MTAKPQEAEHVHARLMKFTLGVEEARAYWAHGSGAATAERALGERWFGARSEARVRVILGNLRVRFDAYPSALVVLRRWPDMAPAVRTLVCHWHLQLADPVYRRFTGAYLPDRRGSLRAEATHARAMQWVEREHPGRWNPSSRFQWATKLLAAAREAGFVAGIRDPRPLSVPRVPDEALAYLLYLLREVRVDGGLLDNPYLASVGLTGRVLDERIRRLDDVSLSRMGDLVDVRWAQPSLSRWREARA